MTNVINITPQASDQIVNILTAHPGQVLFLGINNKGCSGHSYTFELQSPDCIKRFDEVIKISEYTVVVAAANVLKLMHSTLDYQTDRFGSKFTWHNPAVKHTCGCGESVGF